MARVDHSISDLPTVASNTPGVPALPALLGNDPVIRAIEAFPAVFHHSGGNARFASHEFFLGAIRNENARRAYMHAVELFLAWAGKHGRGQLTNIAPWEVGAYMGELAKTTSIATRNQHLSGLRHFPVDGALKDRRVFMGIAESRGVEVSDDGLPQVVGHRDFPATSALRFSSKRSIHCSPCL